MRKVISLLIFLFMLFQKTEAQKPAPKQVPIKKKTAPLPPITQSSKKDLTYLIPVVKLKTNDSVYNPKNYFLKEITDSIKTDSLGTGILPRDYTNKKIQFDNDRDKVLFNFMNASIKKDSLLHPVILKIKKIEIKETQLSKSQIKASLDIQIDAYCKISNKEVLIYRFANDAEGETYIGWVRKYDSILSYLFSRLPEKIDEAMEDAIKYSPYFINEVRPVVKIERPTIGSNADTLVLSEQPEFEWDDYKGPVISPVGMYSSFLLIYDSDPIKEGPILNINISIKPVFIRNKSWAGSNIRNNRLLRNERYAAIIFYTYALKFKTQLEKLILNAENFNEQIFKIYSQLTDEMTITAQTFYYEAKQGTDEQKSKKWHKKIEAELNKYLNN